MDQEGMGGLDPGELEELRAAFAEAEAETEEVLTERIVRAAADAPELADKVREIAKLGASNGRKLDLCREVAAEVAQPGDPPVQEFALWLAENSKAVSAALPKRRRWWR
jgi:hypothetical protein